MFNNVLMNWLCLQMRSYLNIMHEQAQQNNYDPDVIFISQR